MRLAINTKCPFCGGNMREFTKQELQLHCRGDCGMIIRFQNTDYEDMIYAVFNAVKNSKKVKTIVKINQGVKIKRIE